MKKIIRVLALFVLATALFACATTAPPTTDPKVVSTVVPPKPETASIAVAETSPPSDIKKHTETGKYVNSLKAYEMWKADPDKVKILDCRIQEEYAFVGHPTMAYNIPSKLWTGKWNEEKKDYDLQDNPDFESYAKKKFALSDTILVMCRSGHRSALSVNRLTKAGFTNVYNITDGFEGDKVKDAESYFNGKRMKNGWKNSGSSWTYDLDPELIYAPGE